MYRTLVILSGLAFIPSGARAQGWIEPHPHRPARGAVVRVASTVRAMVTGPVVRFEIEEQYRNTGGGLAEGTYLFPLPGEAVFTDFSLFQGTEELRGEMLPADQARTIYEEIVRRKRDPALLTLAGHGLVRARVFPIGPGETRRVILRFTQMMRREGDAYRLRYALGQRGGLDSAVRIEIEIPEAETWGRPYSPTHSLSLRPDRGALRIDVVGDRGGDLDLLLPRFDGNVGMALLTHAPAPRENGHFLMVLTPASSEATPTPRDLTLVVDVSGSMAGAKLEQARAALLQAIRTLRPDDRFRLVSFSSGVIEFAEGWSPATPATRQRAERWVDRLEARGGTNIGGALEAALSARASTGRHPMVLFLTDGLPSVGERSPEALGAQAAAAIGVMRVFPIGVGHDVNTYLLDRLARDGRGTVEYVAPGENVEEVMGRVVTRTSRPALTNLRLVRAPVALEALAPSEWPDVFAGDEVVVTGRYRGAGRGPLVIEGRRNGRVERITLQADFPRETASNGFIPVIWASRRIGELTRTIRLEGETPALVGQVRELGLRYGILTPYTSYLVQEPGLLANQTPVVQPTAPRPEAQSGAGAFRAARESRDRTEAKTLNAAEEVALDAATVGFRGGSGLGSVRRTAGRVLVLRNEVWTDMAARDTVPVVAIETFSDAWFDLLRELPELAPIVRTGDTVLVAGRAVNLRLGSTGTSTWKAGELERIVREFRGR